MNAGNLQRVALVFCVLLSFNACRAPSLRAPSSEPDVAAADISGAVAYEVDSAASHLHVLVYRGGAMARLGHNHVVSSKAVTGRLYLHNDLARSHIELALPVASMIVDDPQARAAEGEEFAAEVPQDAREGTQRNLMRAEVLDAAHFPTITLRSAAIAGTRAAPLLTMRVALRGTARDVSVPIVVVEDGKRLTATGEFAIKQTDFGITPFSVALGALQVQDTLRIKFKIVATL